MWHRWQIWQHVWCQLYHYPDSIGKWLNLEQGQNSNSQHSNAISAYCLGFYSTHRTPKSTSTHSQGSCAWLKHDLEVLWVTLKQILQLKVGCSNFGPLRGSVVYPTSVPDVQGSSFESYNTSQYSNRGNLCITLFPQNEQNRVNGRISDRAKIRTLNFQLQYLLQLYSKNGYCMVGVTRAAISVTVGRL